MNSFIQFIKPQITVKVYFQSAYYNVTKKKVYSITTKIR